MGKINCTFELNGKSMSELKLIKCAAAPDGGLITLTACPTDSYPAFSGLGNDVNKRESRCFKDSGPIPPGEYFILQRQSGGYFGAFRDYVSGRGNWFALYANDGKVDDETLCDAVLRGNFRLHPKGPLGISKGCITVESASDFATISAQLRAADVIDVPGTSIKAYGTVVVT
jgi:hypothetical protein